MRKRWCGRQGRRGDETEKERVGGRDDYEAVVLRQMEAVVLRQMQAHVVEWAISVEVPEVRR